MKWATFRRVSKSNEASVYNILWSIVFRNFFYRFWKRSTPKLQPGKEFKLVSIVYHNLFFTIFVLFRAIRVKCIYYIVDSKISSLVKMSIT